MAKSALPLILGAGAIALIATGKKKKKTKSSDVPDEPPPYIPDLPPAPKPKPDSKRPSGNPPRGDSYDGNYWGSNSEERLASIRQHFVELGYQVEVGPWPMNELGPKGTVELKNKSGSMGKLGGDDDKPNATVARFQRDYNIVSRLNKAEKIYPQSMGGLADDGLVGPYTLNGLRFAVEELPGGKKWKDLLQQAALKGIT